VTERARREYAEVLRPRYRVADKQERGRILDEYCRTTGCHRKAAIRRLRAAARTPGRPPGRPARYGPELVPIRERVWRASDDLSGKLLVAILPTWSEWTGIGPGALQGDLVLHCGESTAGFYLTTLVAVDVATTWTELQAVWGLHHRRVCSGVHLLRHRLPFPLREWHSDNGREFINDCLLAWCRREGIRFTRGRPYRKNDQAWVEQRNGFVVRRLVGHDRYSSRAAFAVLQRLYGLLRLQLNFFRPVRKLVSKRRVGSRVVKRYDLPQTPYQRVLAARLLSPHQRHALAQQFHTLDPIALARDIQQTLDLLWKLADTRPRPQEAARG